METPPLGQQELDLLNFIADRAPATARDLVEGFGEPRGLARSTVLTMVDRLRKKGYVSRRRRRGLFHYWPSMTPAEALQSLIRRFVDRTLSGSVTPLVAYLARAEQLTDEEIAQLQELVDEIRARRNLDPP